MNANRYHQLEKLTACQFVWRNTRGQRITTLQAISLSLLTCKKSKISTHTHTRHIKGLLLVTLFKWRLATRGDALLLAEVLTQAFKKSRKRVNSN